MGKDPAVLWYTSDFLTGITFLTDEEIGQYAKLLCQQHQLGHLPLNHMITVCQSKDSPVMKKFVQDDEGLYYNERMELEIQNRIDYCKSRSHKGKSGRKTKKKNNHTKTVRKSYVNRIEDEDVIEDTNKISYNQELDAFGDKIKRILNKTDLFNKSKSIGINLNDAEIQQLIKKGLRIEDWLMIMDKFKIYIDNNKIRKTPKDVWFWFMRSGKLNVPQWSDYTGEKFEK